MLTQEPIQSVEISTIAHATEDLGKVDIALQNLGIHQPLTRRYLEGHHGNPIVKIEAKLTHKTAAQFARLFIQQLTKKDRLLLLNDLQLHSDDEGNLYIRIDKQESFLGTFQMAEDDLIRIKIKFSRLMGDSKKGMMNFLGME
jgi:RNA binding exosome subunit